MVGYSNVTWSAWFILVVQRFSLSKEFTTGRIGFSLGEMWGDVPRKG